MPEDREKVEDFISLWRKKMMNDPSKPSAIGETLDRIQEVEQENEELRKKIKENIQLFTKTEEIVKRTIAENEKLKEELKKSSSTDQSQLNNLQLEIAELTNNVKSLTIRLTERDNLVSLKDTEITGLKLRLNDATSALELMEDTKPEVSQSLVEDLQSKLLEKNSQINELEQTITALNQELTQLNEELIGKETSSHVDYVVPVDTANLDVIKPQSAQTSTKTLELLCQDLQADLNRYKKLIDKLTQEKSELQQAVESGGIQIEPDELKELKNENEDLRIEISQLHENIKEASKTTPQALSLVEATRMVEDLNEKLQEKDQVILQLKKSNQPQKIVPQGPMPGLVEDLQKKINKLKMTIEEKDKIIEELKS
ncbi:MAG: hypothetical protein ACW96S_04230 [Promethearchaeota archaeon]|jgi:DNA repair exonuclease SbcCD ATPase subunit